MMDYKYYEKYYQGLFWINEEWKIHGTLYIDQEGLGKLFTLTNLENDKLRHVFEEYDVVYGLINDTVKTFSVKLYECNQVNFSLGNLNKYEYKSFKPLISTSIDKSFNDNCYTDLILNSEKLDNWVNVSGFDFQLNDLDNYNVVISYNQPSKIELFSNSTLEIYLWFQANSSFPMRRNGSIKERVNLVVEYKVPLPLNKILAKKRVFDKLLSIMLFQPFESENLNLKNDNRVTYYSLRRTDEIYQEISNPIEFDVFVSKANEIFASWLRKYEELEFLTSNFFSVYGKKGVFIENKFVSYVSILESYTSENVENQNIEKSCQEHNCQVRENDSKKIELNLIHRLIWVLDNSLLKDEIINVSELSKRIKTTRNYHIHLEKRHKVKSFKGKEIIQLNKVLEFLIKEIFLREIDLGDYLKPTHINLKVDHLKEYIK